MNSPLRLLADDLTGALDSAAAFATPARPISVYWDTPPRCAGSIVLASGTREIGASLAAAKVAAAAPGLFGTGERIAYKKIDSLLRGSEAEEIGAILDVSRFDHCILAPAFPPQRRVTRGGRQGILDGSGSFLMLETDLAAELEALGHRVARPERGDAIPSGISLWDAETDADLDALVERAGGSGDVLWVGSGGLAAALARRFAPTGHGEGTPLSFPILGLFGSDHSVTREQLSHVRDDRIEIASGDEASAIAGRLRSRGAAFVTIAFPPGTSREAAASRISGVFGEIVARIEPPGTLLVAGGETLRALCDALGADGLRVVGEIMPGIPRSAFVGGRWNGTEIVSKSGAFGAPDLFKTLLADRTAIAPGACR